MRAPRKSEPKTKCLLNPESVILNLVQNLFRAGLFQHFMKSTDYETLKSLDPESSSGPGSEG